MEEKELPSFESNKPGFDDVKEQKKKTDELSKQLKKIKAKTEREEQEQQPPPPEEQYDVVSLGFIRLASKTHDVYDLANLLLKLLEQKNIQELIELIKKYSRGNIDYTG